MNSIRPVAPLQAFRFADPGTKLTQTWGVGPIVSGAAGRPTTVQNYPSTPRIAPGSQYRFQFNAQSGEGAAGPLGAASGWTLNGVPCLITTART